MKLESQFKQNKFLQDFNYEQVHVYRLWLSSSGHQWHQMNLYETWQAINFNNTISIWPLEADFHRKIWITIKQFLWKNEFGNVVFNGGNIVVALIC